MKVQTVLIPRSFGIKKANAWIINHGYKIMFGNKKVHITEDYYRYRQLDPKLFSDFMTMKLSDGVNLVMGNFK